MPKLKLEFLPTTFPANLLVVALPIIPNIYYNFKVILYFTIFVFLSRGSCFISAICIHLEAQQSFFLRQFSPERFEGSELIKVDNSMFLGSGLLLWILPSEYFFHWFQTIFDWIKSELSVTTGTNQQMQYSCSLG